MHQTGALGCCHKTLEGEKSVQHLSRQLTEAERNYATIEKEELAEKWAIETLRYYLWVTHAQLIMPH